MTLHPIRYKFPIQNFIYFLTVRGSVLSLAVYRCANGAQLISDDLTPYFFYHVSIVDHAGLFKSR
jgi:hypothetical protein